LFGHAVSSSLYLALSRIPATANVVRPATPTPVAIQAQVRPACDCLEGSAAGGGGDGDAGAVPAANGAVCGYGFANVAAFASTVTLALAPAATSSSRFSTLPSGNVTTTETCPGRTAIGPSQRELSID